MKLVGIKLQDFQAHKETEIEFSPTITTIRGPTDKGKSAILRALRWTCLNDLAGDEFIREGAKKTSVTLSVSHKGEEKVVTRAKNLGGATNTYLLDDTEYRSFSTSLPSDISSLLSLSEINFQAQHDPPFWFSLTAGEVSRQLNAVIDLSIIDTTLSSINSTLRQSQERVTVSKGRLEEVEGQLKEVEPKKARVAEFQSLKAKDETLKEVKEDHHQLEEVLTKIDSNQADRLSQKAFEGEALLGKAREVIKIRRQEEEVEGILLQVEDLQPQLRVPPDINPLVLLFEEWKSVEKEVEDLARLVQRAVESTSVADTKREVLSTAERQFHQETRGKECPLCRNLIR